MEPGELIFVVDLNEVDDDGRLTVARDYTLNYGAGVLARAAALLPDTWVRVHSDDDNCLFWARVVRQLNDRDLLVEVNWSTRTPVLTGEWSARSEPAAFVQQLDPFSVGSATTPEA